jgi:murein DD-endopeptidase MepM/ murein hydrolase activator NlpD
MRKFFFGVVTLILTLTLCPAAAQADTFTAAEQQQIFIETPGLFERSNSFTVDFSVLKARDYSFPLPVGRAKPHPRGMQIKTTKGDAVKAMFTGTVRLSRNVPGYGNVVVVRHNNGLETVYANNAENLVKVGDHVRAGQTVAIVGDENGEAVCYFGILVNGAYTNPATFVNLNTHNLRARTFLFKSNGRNVDISMIGKAEPEPEPVAAEKPAVDVNADITSREQQIVATPTPGLFDGGNTITINLAKLPDDQWSYPLPGAHVISPFGGRRNHSGVDIKTCPNDEIKAAFDGRVRFARTYFGYGNVIVIRHANGIETLYSHNSKNLVKVGDWVKAGQTIALTGRTGRATTEHCHFEIRINGRAYNPALIFDHKTHQLRKVKLLVNRNGKVASQDVPPYMTSFGAEE